jgi:hypothetical protein
LTSSFEMPNWDGSLSMAWTESTRSSRSSARSPRAVSRSERAEASSGEEAVVVRERMRRYEEKRERVVLSWLRTSLHRRGLATAPVELIMA